MDHHLIERLITEEYKEKLMTWMEVDIRLPGKENSNSHGAKQVH